MEENNIPPLMTAAETRDQRDGLLFHRLHPYGGGEIPEKW